VTNPLLQGLRVLDLTRLLPGPFCTLYLAQMGAEVTKVEDPQGGDYARGMSPDMFALVNRGKRSVTLDLRQPRGAELFRALAAQSDVVVESFRPGVMDRLGCGYETLRALNRKLVYCAITGYGQTGPYRDRAGHDINYRSYAGELHQTGAANTAPSPSNLQLADLAGGALTAATGILAAVLGARTSGEGGFVDIAMHDGTLAMQVVSLATVRTLGEARPRGEDMLSGGLPNYGVYECADGKHVALGALEQKFFIAFCTAAGRPELARKPMATGPAGAPLRAELAALFRTRNRDEWEKLADGDACLSAVLTPAEVIDNAQVRARGMIEDVGGKPAFACPVKLHGEAPLKVGPAPALGADTASILAGLGLGETELAELKRARTI
jgi:alpha-methylacyl-CoA racemase